MAETFWTADTHLGHPEILHHAKRPWTDITDHDNAMIAMWNGVVQPRDTVYILGDFAWRNHLHYLMLLKGKKVLILGSHDRMNQEILRNFKEVYFWRRIAFDNETLVMQHCCPRVWEKSHYGSVALFGHSHGRLKTFNLSFDVGVDSSLAMYKPIPWDMLKRAILMRKADMAEAGRIREENGRILYRQDDVAYTYFHYKNQPQGEPLYDETGDDRAVLGGTEDTGC